MPFATVDERWDALHELQAAYPNFPDFLYDVVTGLMGFQTTANQIDICEYLADGPLYRMIQAQRGQAKTTITAAYAVWRIIHDPTTRILIVSSGDTMAKEISNWVLQILNGMDELECLRADPSLGDRASVVAYDVHRHLKGPEKSPSVACMGITGNMQGKRADILIADDVESQKNSQSADMRERLLHLTRDFTSINSSGDIIYLGTPQSENSIYNSLPGRGFDIRIWPGRFPTDEEIENYGPYLAPFIREQMEKDPSLKTGGGPSGDRGKPTDPVLLGEEKLIKKEIDQGSAYFQLQHMLDTRLSDAERYPLKIEKIIFTDVPAETVPVSLYHKQSVQHRMVMESAYPVQKNFYEAHGHSQEFGAFQGCHMYVDPAGGGQNGDETAYAVTKFSASKVYLVDVGGVPGGLDDEALDALTAVAARWKPDWIGVEKNFGNGALSQIWQPKLLREHVCDVEDVWESGQKELRIIDTLEPLIGAGRFVVDKDLIEKDWKSVQKYPAEKRASYMLFHQLSQITRDKGALSHEDRLDAVAGCARSWIESLAQDEEQAALAVQKAAFEKMMANPLGNGRPLKGFHGATNNPFHSNIPSLKRRW